MDGMESVREMCCEWKADWLIEPNQEEKNISGSWPVLTSHTFYLFPPTIDSKLLLAMVKLDWN